MVKSQNILKLFGEWDIKLKNKINFLNKLIKKAFIQAILWTIIIYIVFKFFELYFDLADFQWIYDISSELYYSLKNNYINNNLLFFIGFIIWSIGIFIIIIKLLFKYNSLIKNLATAINELYDKEVDFIELPVELEELQQKLNNLKKESEKNEKMARETEQRKKDLIVYLAHDLKTPLTSTIGYLSLLDEVNDMPKQQREKYIKTALAKANKLEDLINELFDIARFNSETIVINKENLDLNMMIDQLIDEFYPILEENNKKIEIKCKDKLKILGDSDKIARVLSNLIKNAIYYSKDNKITIETFKESNNAIIEIINKGALPQDKLEKIFEKFYRADFSRNSKTGGSGLGLAIAKEIVELHNGEIFAESTNGYTKFIVKLPC